MLVRRALPALALASSLIAASAFSPSVGRAYTVKQTSTGAVVRWHLNSVSMRIDPSMQEFFHGIPVTDVVAKATSAWHGLDGAPELLLSEGTPGPQGYANGEADNGVYLVRQWDLQENALAVTVATFETDSGRIVDTDVLVNANHPFGLMPDGPDGPADTYDIESVLTHEMGHVLGLGESYDVRQATMWPSVALGETHQRDIDQDDQAGVEEAYAEALPSDVQAPGGCGGASVVVRRAQMPSVAPWMLIAAGVLALAVWLRVRRSGAARSGFSVPVMGLVLLFGVSTQTTPSGGDIPVENERIEVLRTLALRKLGDSDRRKGLGLAARSESARVRLAAAAVLERAGLRDDMSLASRLLLDPDNEVRRVAGLAMERLRTAPPSERLERESPRAQKRLSGLLRGARMLVEGEAVSVGTEQRGGLIWSRFLVHGASEVVEVRIPGGTAGAFSQVVSEQEPPSDGDSVVVAMHDKGPHAWAHLRDGVIYGGSLGEGPAIRWKD